MHLFINLNCRVAFSLVLQFAASLLGSRKSAKIHSRRLKVVCADGIFVVHFGDDNVYLTDHIRHLRIDWLVIDDGGYR